MSSAISWDVFGYYLYLPALFYENDLTLHDVEFANEARNKYDLSNTLYQVHEVEGGNKVIQYTTGYAIISLPAFASGHFIAGATNQPQDGYSMPFQIAQTIWMLIICLLGLFVLRKVLLHYFQDSLTASLILILVLATNYFIQITQNLTTQHGVLFTLQALILWNLIQWHTTEKGKYLVYLSICFGLACVTRPTEAALILLIFLWGYRNPYEALLGWIKTLTRRTLVLFSSIILVVIIAIPQLLYWKIATGHYITNSYANPGEGLDFSQPHIQEFLFSFRKGWLVYTPIMFFAFVGLWVSIRKKMTFSIAVLSFILLNLYLTSSWTTWWYAGSFSQRAMVQSYPMMMLLIGTCIQWLTKYQKIKWFVWLIVVGLTGLNLFQSWQYNQKILDSSRMTESAYFSIFLQTEKPNNLDELLMIDRGTIGIPENRYPEKYHSVEIHNQQFLNLPDSIHVFTSDEEFYNIIKSPYSELTRGEHCWITIEVELFCDSALTDELLIVATMDHGGNYGYSAKGFEPHEYKYGQWNLLKFTYLTPPIREPEDPISVYLWKRKKLDIQIKNIKVTKQILKNESEYDQ
jgi:hypothetical protein